MTVMRCAVLSPSAMILLLHACTVGSRHTPDATLERTFEAHETEFESLRAELEADSQLIGGVRLNVLKRDLSAIERAGLPRERWIHYQDQLRRLGLCAITKGGRGIEFRVDPGTISNGDSYKGFMYWREQPSHVHASLDDYRISKVSETDGTEFGFVLKPLKGNWYLYLFVNRR
jgi:hypothetical protein